MRRSTPLLPIVLLLAACGAAPAPSAPRPQRSPSEVASEVAGEFASCVPISAVGRSVVIAAWDEGAAPTTTPLLEHLRRTKARCTAQDLQSSEGRSLRLTFEGSCPAADAAPSLRRQWQAITKDGGLLVISAACASSSPPQAAPSSAPSVAPADTAHCLPEGISPDDAVERSAAADGTEVVVRLSERLAVLGARCEGNTLRSGSGKPVHVLRALGCPGETVSNEERAEMERLLARRAQGDIVVWLTCPPRPSAVPSSTEASSTPLPSGG